MVAATQFVQHTYLFAKWCNVFLLSWGLACWICRLCIVCIYTLLFLWVRFSSIWRPNWNLSRNSIAQDIRRNRRRSIHRQTLDLRSAFFVPCVVFSIVFGFFSPFAICTSQVVWRRVKNRAAPVSTFYVSEFENSRNDRDIETFTRCFCWNLLPFLWLFRL